MSRNRLDRSQTRMIEDWLIEHKDEIEDLEPVDITRKIINDLGFPVTINNVNSAAKVCNIKFTNMGIKNSALILKEAVKEIVRIQSQIGMGTNEILEGYLK